MVDQQHPLSDVKLLIVEDEPLISLIVEEFASTLGCRTYQTAATVFEALSLIDEFKPQFALVDYSLTHGSPDFIVANSLDCHLIPFIFTSGHVTKILPGRHNDRDFLANPFSLEDLKETIVRIRLDSKSSGFIRVTRPKQ